MKKYKKLYLLLTLIVFLFALTGCDKGKSAAQTQEEFDALSNEVFLDNVQSDSITLNYTLANPEKYGITNYKPTLGDFTLEAMKESLAKSENYAARLKAIDYKKLTDDQKLTYDVMKDYYKVDDNAEDLLLYYEVLSPTVGLQAQLPILYAEYSFYDKDDIDAYLELLPCTYDYFNQIIEFEKLKSDAGLFMSDRSADDIIKQCEALIADKENNFLITVFNDKVKQYDGLTKDEIKTYQEKNKDAVINYVIPAYQLIIDGLKSLKGTGTNEGGLCNLDKGKEYYKSLVRTETGSNRSVEELIKLLDKYMDKNIASMQTLLAKDASLLDQASNPSYPMTDPEEILTYLQDAIKDRFPDMDKVNYTIKYVHKSLEDFISPAFYLTPAIDNYEDNSIYINGSDKFDLSQIFTTLAHEGYPGHLFQNVYYAQQNPAPIRSTMNFGGYSEGWATYVEMISYHMAGIDDNLASLLEENNAVILMMYARADIGINYEGWSRKESDEYLKGMLGITDEETLDQFYISMVEEPANYLQYTIGYIELMELRNKAEKALEDKFSEKDFHEFILKTGPSQFFVIDKYLDKWINSAK
ncbi:Uncharacterized conserved protein, DUF885 familyt [Anaerosporobacter mobilis DSM 15930]|uniref:Uncharacterized conserved protein, DUF885 familyt n=1 Tax=Anaerosporobacter mobilis DSM 15930 TaxID=1120996 RepID=A0A1M7G272_9FIRM|nr:DUF885 domain-containing protein [Anaerosporobacter mobilis]SHM10178.1 Uncharacterized conserved protein, DUF885 familyt [Anaerosporobacter mobilis DSM 15930]